jgi:hypothetical protein
MSAHRCGGDDPRFDCDFYGVVVRADGERELLTEPVTADHAYRALGDVALAVPGIIWPGVRFGEIVMFVDDDGHAKQLPLSHYATELYGTGWRILGDVVVCSGTEPDEPLPDDLLEHLLGGPVKHAERQRSAGWIEHDLAAARRFQAAYRTRPDRADPHAAEMRVDNERDIVQLVAELRAAQTVTPPTTPPGGVPTGRHRYVVQQGRAPEPRDRRPGPPGPELTP